MTNGLVPIRHVVECLVREVTRRREAYPTLVRRGKMEEHVADREIERMSAALEIVQRVEAGGEVS
jgi:hypothetical protein